MLMAQFQVAWNPLTKVALVQALGDALPTGSTNAGSFLHTHANDVEGPDVNHVLYHHVRDVLYHKGVQDMGAVTILTDTDYVALASIVIAPGTVTLAVNATQQLTITKTPSNASNGSVVWTTSNAARATVSATGLVTAKTSGTCTITATSVDGAKVATRTVTVS